LYAGAAPPLVMGVAALCLPWLAGLAAGSLVASSPGGVASIARALASASDRLPYLIPALGVWLAMTPTLLAAWEGGEASGHAREERAAAAVLAGAGRARARRLATAGSRADAIRRFLLTACLAATNVAPALLLAHHNEIRTAGPGILLLREDPEYGQGPASALAVAAVVVNVLVVFLCSPASRATPKTNRAVPPNGEPTRR
jgi:hypothetical protein